MATETPAMALGGARGAMRYVLLISAVAATGGFLFGYDTAVVNGTVGALERHFRTDPGRLGFAIAAALLGSVLGALLAGRFADRWGRVPAMKVTALLFAVGSFGSGIAESVPRGPRVGGRPLHRRRGRLVSPRRPIRERNEGARAGGHVRIQKNDTPLPPGEGVGVRGGGLEVIS